MKKLLSLLALACLLPVTALAQQVSVNYNHSTDFSQFHTYAWGSNNANRGTGY